MRRSPFSTGAIKASGNILNSSNYTGLMDAGEEEKQLKNENTSRGVAIISFS